MKTPLFLLLPGLFLAVPCGAAPPASSPVPPRQQQGTPALPPDGEEDILGPRDPVVIPVPEKYSWAPWYWTAGGLLAGGLLFLALRHGRGKARETAPAERALADLAGIDTRRNTLEAAVLAEQSADAVRAYVARRFGIAAPNRTTEEFLRELASNTASPLAPHLPVLHGFLRSCDMAKFAGAAFDAAERLTLLETAIRFVRVSNTPAPPVPPAPLPPPPLPPPAPSGTP